MSNEVICRYEILARHYKLELPRGAKILSAARQGYESICIWVSVDPSADRCLRRIIVVTTGDPTPPGAHIGTIVMNAQDWHVFDLGEIDLLEEDA